MGVAKKMGFLFVRGTNIWVAVRFFNGIPHPYLLGDGHSHPLGCVGEYLTGFKSLQGKAGAGHFR